ncbi:hypothetical protein MKX03_011272 [Papaver bracteatum]|nr:hypothetical protein MKX03_011272 [Papaver bracteatum]
MDGQEGEAVARIPKVNDNQIINQLQTISRKLTGFGTKFRELDNRYLNWVSKQSFPVQATVVATSSAIHGAAFGGLLGAVGQVAWHVFPKHSLPFKAFCPSPMVEARTFAAMRSTYASVTFIMKRIRGEEDVQTRMAADFVSGAMCRLVTRMGDPYVAVDAVVVGTICALVGGTVFQVKKPLTHEWRSIREQDASLSNLGLQNYEKNFKKGLLTDITMPLLTEKQVLLREFVSPLVICVCL